MHGVLTMTVRMVLSAAVLGACVWAGIGTTQAAPGAAHGTDSPSSADSGGATYVSEDAGSASAAQLREQALAAMEALREEIATLTALRDAQAALLAWNRETPWNRGTLRHQEGTTSGASPQALPAALCSDPAIGAWCPLLPATFGAPHTPSGGNTLSGGNAPSGGKTEDGHDRD